jgi:uncharacterized metal-binding protein
MASNHPTCVVVKPLPLLYPCDGCAEIDQIARDVAAILDRRGVVEMAWLCAARPDSKPKPRFPIIALDGCAKACALGWLATHGVVPECHYVLAERGEGAVERAADAIAAQLK